MDLSGAPASWTHTSLHQQVLVGQGVLDDVGDLVKSIGSRRVLLVTTKRRLAGDAGERLRSRLGRLVVATFDTTESHVPTTQVREAVQLANDSGIDGIVSFGGGSCNDLGKAVSFFSEQAAGQPATTHLDRPLLPHVAVPTTWSGAELTWFFGMTDPATKRKQGGGSVTCAPVAAVYDPLAVSGLDKGVSAGSGMNCIAHGVEAAWSPTRTPEAEAVALACISRAVEALPAVVDDPDDPDALLSMCAAAVLGGRALQNAGMGIHHGLAQLVGGRTGVAHGMANGILLPHSIAFNAADPLLGAALHRIGTAFGDPGDPAGAAARLRDRIGLPSGLAAVGVTDEDCEAIAEQAVVHPTVRNNPRPVELSDTLGVLRAAL